MTPQLPIPNLAQTVSNYLNRIRPLLTGEEYRENEEIANNFLKNTGAKLDEALRSFAQSAQGSWLLPFWLDGYLSSRAPLNGYMNYSTSLVTSGLPKTSFPEFCAKAVFALVSLHLKIAGNELPAEEGSLGTLCGSQYYNMFAACRIPQAKKDRLFTSKGVERKNAYVAVFFKENTYILQVVDDGKPISLDVLAKAISDITERQDDPAPNVGIFTAAPRDEAASLREHLISIGSRNKNNLQQIEESLFALCIDDIASPRSPEKENFDFMYGYGKNRWFDKSVQLIVGTDYTIGLNYEHTGYDGAVGIVMLRDLWEALKNAPASQISYGKTVFSKLSWETDDKALAAIKKMEENDAKRAGDFGFHLFHFKDFGSSRIKELKCSPDAFFHLGVQLGWFRFRGRLNNTYEAVSARQFSGGRTECMRPSTNEVLAFVSSYGSASAEKQRELARAALAKHSAMLKECQEAQAPERHLTGLQSMLSGGFAPGAAQELPKNENIFESKGYRLLKHDILSTSGLSLKHMDTFAFGPVVADGFGFGYNICPDEIKICITCLEPQNTEKNAQTLSNHIRQAYLDLSDLLKE